jgi:hypothetical protein
MIWRIRLHMAEKDKYSRGTKGGAWQTIDLEVDQINGQDPYQVVK